MRVVGYVRVSTADQALGLSPAAQEQALRDECDARGWELVDVEREVKRGWARRRPAYERALRALDAGEYDAMMISRLDRVARSLLDICALLERAEREGWALVCLSPRVDLSDPFGQAMAQVAGAFAELERKLIAQRQRESIAARRAAGTWKPSPALITGDAQERVAHLVSEGWGARRIMRQLELEGFPAPKGRAWHMSTVQAAMRRARAA